MQGTVFTLIKEKEVLSYESCSNSGGQNCFWRVLCLLICGIWDLKGFQQPKPPREQGNRCSAATVHKGQSKGERWSRCSPKTKLTLYPCCSWQQLGLAKWLMGKDTKELAQGEEETHGNRLADLQLRGLKDMVHEDSNRGYVRERQKCFQATVK